MRRGCACIAGAGHECAGERRVRNAANLAAHGAAWLNTKLGMGQGRSRENAH